MALFPLALVKDSLKRQPRIIDLLITWMTCVWVAWHASGQLGTQRARWGQKKKGREDV